MHCHNKYRDTTWGPGDLLPTTADGHGNYTDLHSITTIFQTMQQSIGEQLSNVCSKMDDLSGKMEALEDRQKSFETDMMAQHTSNNSPSPAVSGKRQRVTPAALQVNTANSMCCIYSLYF